MIVLFINNGISICATLLSEVLCPPRHTPREAGRMKAVAPCVQVEKQVTRSLVASLRLHSTSVAEHGLYTDLADIQFRDFPLTFLPSSPSFSCRALDALRE